MKWLAWSYLTVGSLARSVTIMMIYNVAFGAGDGSWREPHDLLNGRCRQGVEIIGALTFTPWGLVPRAYYNIIGLSVGFEVVVLEEIGHSKGSERRSRCSDCCCWTD